MSACAAGDLVARCVAGAALPTLARPLSLARHEDHALMAALQNTASRGLL
jgi:hypothetical protein